MLKMMSLTKKRDPKNFSIVLKIVTQLMNLVRTRNKSRDHSVIMSIWTKLKQFKKSERQP